MVTGGSESRVSGGVRGGALSPFVLMGLGVLSQKNIGKILSQHAGARDGENKDEKCPFRHIHVERRNSELQRDTWWQQPLCNRQTVLCQSFRQGQINAVN